MKRFFDIACNQKWRLLLIPILVFGALSFEDAYGASSGLKIEIALDGGDQHPLGFPIALRMVITNDSQWSIYTKKGFSQTEFYRSLILTDPNGEKRIYIPATIPVDTMLPSLIYGNRQVSLAQALLPGVVKAVTIADLAQLFPIIDTVPGWYTLEAQQPFVRFAETIAIENFGVLGLADDPDKWQGTVNSNKVQFYLYPATGGQLKVQVLDNAVVPPAPLFQVPVRVFKSVDIPADNPMAETWSKVKPELEGETDNSGQTLWASETTPCLIGDDYTVIARYSDEYQEDTIGSSDSGWQTGCTGLVEKTLAFGQAPPQAMPGDLDGDGDVDRDDMNVILAARNTPATGPDDPRDLDGDGMITGPGCQKTGAHLYAAEMRY